MAKCCDHPYITWAADKSQMCTIICHSCRAVFDENLAVSDSVAKIAAYRFGDYGEQQLDMFSG